ncbi:helix-turn-helix domain-containing protein [Achromobacter ruhlandii]|uniref:helix-turn-helix domain-containing protein n=1 Tax=Achromobacter ruhlandii TaxID=72557 RepID=UPI001EED9B1D|nr:helix-turn-helix domain-containing protein [Achromobacter ruhlandii]
MDEKAHIAEAIAMAGGLTAVAKQAKPKRLTAWAVSKWLEGVPPGRVLFLSELTGWVKTPHQLCAEIYPNPTDGLPPEALVRAVLGVDGLDIQDEEKARGAGDA